MGIWHEIEKGPGHWIEEADKKLREWATGDIYIGTKSTDDGKSWQLTTSNSDRTVYTGQNSGRYSYGNAGRSNTNAYKANAAGTANKIAQGGMTKDDILKYNVKHPNEIAGDNPANTTALNSNTAIRSK